MDLRSYVEESLDEHLKVVEEVRALAGEIHAVAEAMSSALRNGHKLLFCGNGGSAADAQHLAAELVGRFMRERRAWPALALNANSSSLTSIGNDYGFDSVFARQVQGLGAAGDVLVAISTSGNSRNVSAAVRVARERGLHTVGLSGRDGGELREMCDRCIVIPSDSTPRIQEMHITVGHILCGLVEDALC